MKIIFLDFDGVLCNEESMVLGYQQRRNSDTPWSPGDDPYGPHPDCIKALNRIIKETDAKIVVSSAWRHCPIAETRARLKRWGVEGTFIGVTPSFYDEPRGNEIRHWLNSYCRPVESFVILDDNADMSTVRNRLVHTDFHVGLTEANADRAIAMLNAKAKAKAA